MALTRRRFLDRFLDVGRALPSHDLVHQQMDYPQVRAYAEYRLFAKLAPYARFVRSARVILQRVEHDGTEGVVCAVTVTWSVPATSALVHAGGTAMSRLTGRQNA